jgi:hypothetical protein
MAWVRRSTVLALAACLCACQPTYAPPPRTAHGSAPGRADGMYELRLTGGAPLHVNGALAIPIGNRTHIELGADFAESWVLGSGGLRLTGLREPLDDDGDLALVIEFGGNLAFGRGGERCGNSRESMPNCDGEGTADGKAWHQRLAYGAALDAGVALHVTDWFAPFLRAMMQFSKASGVPGTIWFSGLGGLDFRIDFFSFYFGLGFYGFTNELDSNDDFFVEAGLAVQFGGDDDDEPVEEPASDPAPNP